MNPLEDALIGTDRDRTLVGLGVFVVAAVAVVVEWILGAHVLTGNRALWLVGIYDSFAAIVIVLIAASWVAGIVYAGVNGGPGLAIAISLGPTVLGSVLRGQVGLTVDFALAMGMATLAGWTACYVTYRRRRVRERIELGIGMTSAVTLVSASVLREVSPVIGPYAELGGTMATLAFSGGVAIVVGWVLAIGWADSTVSTSR